MNAEATNQKLIINENDPVLAVGGVSEHSENGERQAHHSASTSEASSDVAEAMEAAILGPPLLAVEQDAANLLPIIPGVLSEGGEGGEPSAQQDGVGGEGLPTVSTTEAAEAGKGGGAAPPLPPLQPAPAENAASFPAMVASDVFTPAPAQNPVLLALQRETLYREPIGCRRHRIHCPWGR